MRNDILASWNGVDLAMSSNYHLQFRIPTIDEYRHLCVAVGWEAYINFEAAEASLRHSLYGVVVLCEKQIVGMGRVVGDGNMYFYIQDIAVAPDHQHRGVGTQIMKAITTYLHEHAPEKAFVGLFASQGKEPFYTNYGINRHEGMTGMFGVMHDREIK